MWARQALLDVVDHRDIEDVVEVALGDDLALAEHVLDALGAGFGQGDRLELLVLFKGGFVLDEVFDDGVDGPVEVAAVFGGAADDEGGAGFVDEDAVHLVDDGVAEVALDHVVQAVLHVVAQVVEAELVVGAVGDVGGVGLAALEVVEAVNDDASAHAEEAVELAHPFAVAGGEVVVDGDDVDALGGQGVEIDGEGGDEGLAFAGLHLGDLAVVEDHAADELHVEVTEAEDAAGGFADGGEGFGQQVVERGAGGQAFAELGRLGGEGGVGQGSHAGLEGVDLRHAPLIAFE